MNLKDLIKSIDGWESKSYQEIADVLNKKDMVPNSTPLSLVPRPLAGVDEIFAILFDDESTFPNDLLALEKMERVLLIGKTFSEYCAIPFSGALRAVTQLLLHPYFSLSPSTAVKVVARLDETMDDPDWQEFVVGSSPAEKNGFSNLEANQIQYALNKGDD